MTGALRQRLGAAALLAAVLLAGLLALFPVTDPDIWWHLKTGELIVGQKAIPRTDPYTHTATGRTWVTHEWLAEVVFYQIDRLGGTNLLVIFKAILAATAVALGAAAALVGGDTRARLPVVALGALLAGPLLADRAFVRPHMFTAVCVGGTLLLLRLEMQTGRRGWRLALVPLFMVWANLHSGFVVGLLVVALHWMGEALGRQRGRKLDRQTGASVRETPGRLATFALVVAATLANPHHIHAFLYPFALMARAEVREGIIELRSVLHPAYHGGLLRTALIATGGVALVMIAASRRRLDAAALLLGLIFGALAVRSVRSVTEFAVLVPLLIGVHGNWVAARRGLAPVVAALVIMVAVLGGAVVARYGIPLGRGETRALGLGVDRSRIPDAAVAFLRATQPAGEIFNVMGYGSYLIHELGPARKVFVDGRLDVFPPGFLRAYGRLMSTGERWDETCRAYGITIAVLDYPPPALASGGLWARLRDDPDWVCVLFSRNLLVYARRVRENEAIIARFGCLYDPSVRTVESIWNFAAQASAEKVARTVSAMTEMVEIVPDDKYVLVVLGQMLDASGRSAEGASWIRRALALDPTSVDARLLLAAALARAGAFDEARRELSAVFAQQPRRHEALLVLADIEERQGDREAALRALERAAHLAPQSYHVHMHLGALQSRRGNLQEARQHYARALALRPNDRAARQELESVTGEASP